MNKEFVSLLSATERKKTMCDACNEQARIEIHLKDSTKVLWFCSQHQRRLWAIAQEQDKCNATR